MNTYIHNTNHRVRVRSDYIFDHPKEVEKLIEDLNKIEAITAIKYKKYAGSVAITFDPAQLDSESILEILDSHGWMASRSKPSFVENAVVSGTKTLAKGVAGVMLKRLLGPTVSRVILSL
ncbi:HMA2 domain-containing protein [Veronia pacifica]|uniref:HMA domain-containing protein n=1 Tax=Veronia pacifica TaxID=1080227 RepID=A0A1C3ES30_9GAMM|nr:hypothetical protein [Veronia pacifica]ODA36067.1 hypothetical protein A8L45_00210 [Veronia pacifica]